MKLTKEIKERLNNFVFIYQTLQTEEGRIIRYLLTLLLSDDPQT